MAGKDFSSELPLLEKKVSSVLSGEILSYGLAMGKATFFKLECVDLKNQIGLCDPSLEAKKMKQAISKLQSNIGNLLAETAIILTEESLEILDVYRLIVQDSMFERDLLSYIEQGKTALEATDCVTRDLKKKMITNTFWKTRFYDMQYLLQKLRQFLKEIDNGLTHPSDQPNEFTNCFSKTGNSIPTSTPIVLIADYISPADLLTLYRMRRIAGLVLKDKGQTSHTAIIARSLRLPALGNLNLNAAQIREGTSLIIDANDGKLYIHPSLETVKKIQYHAPSQNSHSLPLQTLTKDNIPIDIYINANIKEDLKSLQTSSIKGVGLFRTEILFMIVDNASDLSVQVEEYKNILNIAADKTVIFRTVDMSDDKDSDVFEEKFKEKYLPSLNKAPMKEAIQYSKHLALNTQMGKVIYNRHFFLKTQIQALLQARIQSQRPFDPIYIMIPMISNIVELKTYQKIIEAEARYLACHHPSIVSQIRIGIMVEVPALIYQLDELCPTLDFVSIGTNDLFQFFFAANRWDTYESQDSLAPAFLKFLGQVIQKLSQYPLATHVCGEMTANPLTAMVLLAMGIRKLSVATNAIQPILGMIHSLPLNLLYPYLQTFRATPYEMDMSNSHTYKNAIDLRNTLQSFITKNGVKIS